jgi:hypothetical protein
VALAYRIDGDIVTISGDYAEPEEWHALLAAVGADPAYRPGSCFLRDLRGSAHPVSAESVVGIIAVVRRFWDRLGVRRAAIVTGPVESDPAVIAHALADAEDIPLQAFTAYDDAVAWLRRGTAAGA